MNKVGFNNDEYLKLQSEKILERIALFENKLYLEFGGKLYDDYHAARVLPGFKPDIKVQLLKTLADSAEIVIVINASDIDSSKAIGDSGISYDDDVLRLIDEFRNSGLYVGSVVISQYLGQLSSSEQTSPHYAFAGSGIHSVTLFLLFNMNPFHWASC